jgi:hypothetical protein
VPPLRVESGEGEKNTPLDWMNNGGERASLIHARCDTQTHIRVALGVHKSFSNDSPVKKDAEE